MTVQDLYNILEKLSIDNWKIVFNYIICQFFLKLETLY